MAPHIWAVHGGPLEPAGTHLSCQVGRFRGSRGAQWPIDTSPNIAVFTRDACQSPGPPSPPPVPPNPGPCPVETSCRLTLERHVGGQGLGLDSLPTLHSGRDLSQSPTPAISTLLPSGHGWHQLEPLGTGNSPPLRTPLPPGRRLRTQVSLGPRRGRWERHVFMWV